jgi:hypothetical protein
VERDIASRIAESVTDLLGQMRLLRMFIGLGQMTNNVDIKLCENIIAGLERLAEKGGAT